jgi:hypothetical protein
MMNFNMTFNQDKNRWEVFSNGKMVGRSPNKVYLEKKFAKLGNVVDNMKQSVEKIDEFGINKRFDFVTKMVDMVSSKTIASAIITGQGGLGKSHTVIKSLKDKGFTDVTDLASFEEGAHIRSSKSFRIIKGFSTAKGLYRTLFEGNNMTLVFDDCDSVLKDPVALNILKGALDSYSDRYISWNSDMRDDDLPRSFKFEGTIIFISNMELDRIDQAIRSRAMCVDLSMTQAQKIERMEVIAESPEFLPEYDTYTKKLAIGFIRDIQDKVSNLSLRSLIATVKIAGNGGEWKDLAKYVLTQGA